MRRVALFVYLLPRRILIGVMHVYRAVISPLYGDVCRFYPTCSAYSIDALREHGVFKGIWMTTKRLARCNPWNDGGVDFVPKVQRPHRVIEALQRSK